MKTKRATSKVGKFILSHVADHPNDIVNFVAEKLDVSRQSVHRHISRLVMRGTISRIGRTKGARYYLNTQDKSKLSFDLGARAEWDVWKENFAAKLVTIPDNIRDICSYGFTEMFNNAIDHSGGAKITVDFQMAFGQVEFQIADDGVGAFKRVKDYYQLPSIREAILQLSKGKVTTDPERHSGEGIFFTSRMFDEFSIFANDMNFKRYEKQEDWLLAEANPEEARRGTLIRMAISLQSQRTTSDVFQKYSLPDFDDKLGFDKTRISIHLSSNGEDTFISRSQAKRVLSGANKFQHIELDFRAIRTVGQGFVDEVFRIFKSQYPNVTISYVNATPDVTFMIERGVTSPRK